MSRDLQAAPPPSAFVEGDVLVAAIDKLDREVAFLDALRERDLDDPVYRAAAERGLERAVDRVLEVGDLLLRREGLATPAHPARLLRVLVDAQLLPRGAGEFDGVAGLASLAFHGCDRLAPERLARALEGLPDFRTFGARVRARAARRLPA